MMNTLYFFSKSSELREIDQTNCIYNNVMRRTRPSHIITISYVRSTKIVNFMAPGSRVLELGLVSQLVEIFKYSLLRSIDQTH